MNFRVANNEDRAEFEAELLQSPLMTYWANRAGEPRRSLDGRHYLNPEVDLIWIGFKIARGLV